MGAPVEHPRRGERVTTAHPSGLAHAEARVEAQSASLKKELGVRDLGSDNLVALRIHGASINYVRDLRDLGYPNLSADDLVSMRIHGVTPTYIRDLNTAGFANIPVEKLVEMKIHGIDAEFVKRTK